MTVRPPIRAVVAAALLSVVIAAGMGAPPARAIGANETLADPALEARARALFREFRCLVCQNQSIDDSDADLARDLRVLVRERIQAGDSDAQVIRFLADRYGDFVLLKPPLKASTVALWAAPFALLLIGGAALAARARRRPAAPAVPLSAAERARLAELMGTDPTGRDAGKGNGG